MIHGPNPFFINLILQYISASYKAIILFLFLYKWIKHVVALNKKFIELRGSRGRRKKHL